MFFFKKSGIFWSIIILESPQLGIVKMKIKIIIYKIVLKRPKKTPFVRDSFFIRNERACWWILYLIFTWITITNWILMFSSTNIISWKSIQDNRTNNSNFRYSFPLLLSSRGTFEQEFFVFSAGLSSFWLERFLFLVMLTFSESFLLFWICWSQILTEGSLNVCWGALFWSLCIFRCTNCSSMKVGLCCRMPKSKIFFSWGGSH